MTTNPICEVDTAGYCARHRRRHTGSALVLALDQGPRGAHHREQWDIQLAMRDANEAAGVIVTPHPIEVRQKRVVKKALPLVRPDRCEHLGKRETFRHGCGGMSCLHSCDLGLPAVPAEFCQTCDQYESGGEGVKWLS